MLSVCVGVFPFDLLNQWTDINEVFCKRYAIGGHLNQMTKKL